MAFWDFLKPKPVEPFKIRIETSALTIYLVSGPDQYQSFHMRARKVQAYYLPSTEHRKAELWVQAKRYKNGKIGPKGGWRRLGHEVGHWIDELSDKVINPDKVYVPEE